HRPLAIGANVGIGPGPIDLPPQLDPIDRCRAVGRVAFGPESPSGGRQAGGPDHGPGGHFPPQANSVEHRSLATLGGPTVPAPEELLANATTPRPDRKTRLPEVSTPEHPFYVTSGRTGAAYAVLPNWKKETARLRGQPLELPGFRQSPRGPHSGDLEIEFQGPGPLLRNIGRQPAGIGVAVFFGDEIAHRLRLGHRALVAKHTHPVSPGRHAELPTIGLETIDAILAGDSSGGALRSPHPHLGGSKTEQGACHWLPLVGHPSLHVNEFAVAAAAAKRRHHE